jgi:hypothetical protein
MAWSKMNFINWEYVWNYVITSVEVYFIKLYFELENGVVTSTFCRILCLSCMSAEYQFLFCFTS